MYFKNFILLTILICNSHLFAQQPKFFTISATKGHNFLIKNNSEIKLHPGDKLFNEGSIKVSANSFLNMVLSTGKILEIKNEGVFNLDSLFSSFKSESSSFVTRFMNYVMDNIINLTSKTRKSETIIGGYVNRSTNEEVELNMPFFSNILTKEIRFTWNSSNSDFYTLNIYDDSKNPVINYKTKDTFYVYYDTVLQNGTKYLWNVFGTQQNATVIKSRTDTIYILDDSTKTMILEELRDIRNELGDDSTATNKMVFGFYCETKQLNFDALYFYQEALLQQPDVSLFKKTYKTFLERTTGDNLLKVNKEQ